MEAFRSEIHAHGRTLRVPWGCFVWKDLFCCRKQDIIQSKGGMLR